jgi:hypothetical protein
MEVPIVQFRCPRRERLKSLEISRENQKQNEEIHGRRRNFHVFLCVDKIPGLDWLKMFKSAAPSCDWSANSTEIKRFCEPHLLMEGRGCEQNRKQDWRTPTKLAPPPQQARCDMQTKTQTTFHIPAQVPLEEGP